MTKVELEAVIEEQGKRIEELEQSPVDLQVNSQSIIFGDKREDRLMLILKENNEAQVYFENQILISPVSANSFTVMHKKD